MKKIKNNKTEKVVKKPTKKKRVVNNDIKVEPQEETSPAPIRLPNGVLFKTDDGNVCVTLLNNGEWDWENVLKFNMELVKDKFNDLSTTNPFEYVFCHWGDTEFTVENKKTVIPNMSFSKMYDEGKLTETIRVDYNSQFVKDVNVP